MTEDFMVYTEDSEITLLIVEDDDDHAELIQTHLSESGISNPMLRFSNGKIALDYLQKEKESKSQKYFLVLLDIRMPIMSGVELLKELKQDNQLKKIPVIMLTTTDDEREIEECYLLGCNSYITKPLDFKKFIEMLKRLGLFLQIIKISRVC